MAQVIDSLLIGVGFQTDQASLQNAEGSLDGLKSKALQVGSVLAGAFGVGLLASSFAKDVDEVSKFSDRWGIAANDVAAYDRAQQHAGGAAGDFLGNITSLSKALATLPFEKAQLLGKLAPLGIAGQVGEVLKGKDAIDSFLISADQLSTLSGGQREKFIEALGFDQASVALLDEGRAGILSAVAAEKSMSTITGQMSDTAKDFNDELQDLKTNAGGFSNEVAEPIAAGLADIMVGMNDWIEANREVLRTMSALSGNAVADSISGISLALAGFGSAGVLSGLAAAGRRIGIISTNSANALRGIGALSRGLGLVGVGIAISDVAKSIIAPIIAENKDTNQAAAVADTLLIDGSMFGGVDELIKSISDFVPDFGGLSNRPGTSQSSNYGTQQQNVKVEVFLDGAPVKAIVKQFNQEQNQQLVEDNSTSNGR